MVCGANLEQKRKNNQNPHLFDCGAISPKATACKEESCLHVTQSAQLLLMSRTSAVYAIAVINATLQEE